MKCILNEHPVRFGFGDNLDDQVKASDLDNDLGRLAVANNKLVGAPKPQMSDDESTNDMASNGVHGEMEDTEELYAGSLVRQDTEELYEDRGVTKGYQRLERCHSTLRTTAPLPATFRNDIDADTHAPLPETFRECGPRKHTELTASSEEPLMECSEEPMVHRECSQCQKETEEDDGRVDENDGCWYCNECWSAFHESL